MVSLYTPGTPLTTFTSLSGPTRAQYRELAAARHGSFYYPARLETCLHCDIHTLSLDHHHHFTLTADLLTLHHHNEFTLTAYTITILSLFITSPSSTYFHQPGHSRLYDNDPVEHSHCPSDKVIIRSPQSHILHPVSVVRSQKHQLRTYPVRLSSCPQTYGSLSGLVGNIAL